MTNLPYAGRVALITGSSGGIGKACAEEFVRAGADVVVSSNRENEGSAVAASAQETARVQGFGSAHFVFCDVRKTEDIQNLIEAALSLHRRIDCLINNAGWHPPHKPIDEFSVHEFRELIDLNLISVFAACKFALPSLRQSKGNIINIASLVATIGQHHASTYVATKGAVAAFTRA